MNNNEYHQFVPDTSRDADYCRVCGEELEWSTHALPAAAVADSKDQHIANLESELQIARDLIQQKNERLMEIERQLAAAELGSSMQHERYGSY